MPQVPYSGVPDVAPQDTPLPRYTADTPVAAFGGATAHALTELGSSFSKDGDELFARADAMQQLKNHSEAQEAAAKFMENAGDIHAKLGSMQGKDAVDYYANGFKTDLETARKNIRDNLSNPMAQKLFDSESLSTVGRTMFNGAGIAATANKAYAINSVESQIKNEHDLAATSDNPKDVAIAKQRISSLSAQRGVLKGEDPESVDQYTKTINSSLTLNVIKQTARTEPSKAESILAENRSSMTSEDYDRARTVIDNTQRAVGSVNIAQKIITSHIGDDGKPDVSFEVMQREAEAEAKRVSPTDALMQKHTVDALKGLYNQKIYADKQFKWENSQTVDAAIQNGVKNIQELRASDPKVAEAIDNLPKSEQLKIPARINAYNSAKDKVANQESLTQIAGLRNNDVESFLNLDPTDPKLHLSQTQQREVMGWQTQDKKNQNGDPRVNRALTWLRDSRGGELAALGVYHRDAKNPEDYDHMTGTLQSALDLWQQTNGKPASYDDVVNKIGPQVIQSRSVPGRFWGNNVEPFYKPDTNSTEYKNFTAKVTKDVTDAGQPAPSEAEIDRAYTRVQLMKLYPGKAKSTNGQ
jgi:hypothetical protein